MKVMFCEYDGGNELLEMDRNDISDLMAILNSKNGKIIIQHEEDEYFFGKLEESSFEMMIDAKTGMRTETLKLYFAKYLRNVSLRNTLPPRMFEMKNQ